jgi:hypothetical protein
VTDLHRELAAIRLRARREQACLALVVLVAYLAAYVLLRGGAA